MSWIIAAMSAVLLAFIVLHLRIRSHPALSYRQIALRALSTQWPEIITEIRRRERLAAWHKTSPSAGQQRVWGYVDRHSIDPGGSFRLMLSAMPGTTRLSGRVEIYRVGYESDGDRRLVWRSDSIEVSAYRARRAGRNSMLLDQAAAALGPAWPPLVTISQTDGWETGYYSVDFVCADSWRDADIAFIVVTDPRRTGDVLVKLSTATYQAYNRWGGHSLYDDDDDPLQARGSMVSFDRPTRSEFWEWEYYFVLWIEKLAREEGFTVSYATNFDVATKEAFTSKYKLFVSVGHDEYWSKEEFDRTYERIFSLGGNTLFLGANTAYWRVRYVDVNDPLQKQGRQMVCYKSAEDPVHLPEGVDRELHLTRRFRDAARTPESMLMGVAYQSNLKDRYQVDPGYAYYVQRTDLPFFAGTGYKKGDCVAEIIGHEWDNRDPEADYAPPGESVVENAGRLWREGVSALEPIPPETIHVLFAGDVVDVHGRKGRAEAVYFESPAGAKVFSSGTNRWTWGLGKEGFIQEQFKLLNRNLILHLLDLSYSARSGFLAQPESSASLDRTNRKKVAIVS
jgi:hypothetical protein